MPQPRRINRKFVSGLRRLCEAEEFIQLLEGTTLFRNIPASTLSLDTLDDIFRRADLKTLPKNDDLPVVVENLDDAFVFEILSGFVKIYDRKKSKKRDGSVKNPPALLAWRVPGELLGDFQFTIPEAKPEDYIVATDKCRLLKLPAPLIKSLARQYPQIYLNIASNLAWKAHKSRVRAQILRLPNIESMLAQLFIELLRERGSDPEYRFAKLINGTFRLDDIAAFLGYKMRRIQEGLHELIDLRLIDHHRNQKSGRFIILNLRELEKLVERELANASRRKDHTSQR